MPKKIQSKKVKKEDDDIIDNVPDDEIIDDDIDNTENDEEKDDDNDYEEEEEDNDDDNMKDCNLDKIVDDDNEYYDDDEEIEAQPDLNIEYCTKEERQSSAKLSKYEMVRILGERIKQLTMGAKPMIKNYKHLPYEKVAEEEFKLNMIPFIIRRPTQNGKYEKWELSELDKDHLLYLLDDE
jgi:DNA-directed RNA polymerase subunit K/omega